MTVEKFIVMVLGSAIFFFSLWLWWLLSKKKSATDIAIENEPSIGIKDAPEALQITCDLKNTQCNDQHKTSENKKNIQENKEIIEYFKCEECLNKYTLLELLPIINKTGLCKTCGEEIWVGKGTKKETELTPQYKPTFDVINTNENKINDEYFKSEEHIKKIIALPRKREQEKRNLERKLDESMAKFIEERDKNAKIEEEQRNQIATEEENSRYICSKVKREVWRRDCGRCINCGSRKNLEYDHIIPFSKGGSNTVRNVQLLCEKCNRKKNSNIE